MKSIISTLSASVVAAMLSFALVSCVNQIQDDSEVDEKVTVNVTFSDFNLSFEEDEITTRASDQTAEDAQVNRIALSIFDSNDQLVYSSTRNASDDNEEFDKISVSLIPAAYSFVAVAHKANESGEQAAAITSPTAATITTSKVLKTFAVKQSVTIAAGQTNNVTVSFGKRITSTFQLATTDDTPAEVVSCEIILNPSASAVSAYAFNPATGFTTEVYQHKSFILRSDIAQGSFKGVTLSTHCLLKENPQNISVTINMKDAAGGIVKSLTLDNVPMAPHRITRATGQFFHASSNNSFTFDTTDDTRYDINF